MRRDDRLIPFSREHHATLRLARLLSAVPAHAPAHLRKAVESEAPTLLRHFREEEALLLPALSRFGEDAPIRRLLDEHGQLIEGLMTAADGPTLSALGTLLAAHVHFEERELFPALQGHCQACAAPPHP